MSAILRFDLSQWKLLTRTIVPPLVLILIPTTFTGRWLDFLEHGAPLAVLLVCGFLQINPRILSALLITALLAMSCLGIVTWILSANIWQHSEKTSFRALLRGALVDSVESSGIRRWELPSQADNFRLTLEARALAGQTGWAWFASEGDIEIGRMIENGTSYTRITTPTSGDPYVMRYFDLGRPTAGNTFRVEMEMRAPQSIPKAGCRGVWLHVWYDGGGAKCESLALDTEWQTISTAWQVPNTARSHIIRVILNNFHGLTYDVRNVILYVACDTGWCRLQPLIPESPYIEIWGEQSRPEPAFSIGLDANRNWQAVDIALPRFALGDSPSVMTARIVAGGGTDLQTRDVEVVADKGTAKPLRANVRQSYFFAHPNFAGHSLAVIGLVVLALSISMGRRVLTALVTLFAVFLTGSRAAWLGALLGTSWLLGLSLGSRRRVWLFLVITVLATGVLFNAQSLGRLNILSFYGDDLGHRYQIWQASAQLIKDSPLFGVGTGRDEFTAAWKQLGDTTLPEVPQHAHNLWLQYAAGFGLPGLLAMMWLTAGLSWLAWRRGHWCGLGIILPVFVMNFFDYTLFYSGVLFPLILGINSLNWRCIGGGLVTRSSSAVQKKATAKS